MPAAIRIGDPVSCGDVMAQGSGNVFVNGIPFTRIQVDNTAGHCYGPTPVSSGSPDVFVNQTQGGAAATRNGDPIVVHTCPPIPASHGGNMTGGSPTVFVNSGSGGGALIDNNPPLSTPGLTPPPNTNPNPPAGTTAADVHIYENNDDPDGPIGGPPPGTTIRSIQQIEEDQTPPPANPSPSQDCSVVDALPANFNWFSLSPTPPSFASWAISFSLSPNFTVLDMTRGAVSSYEFSTSVTQASGLTQKQILLNMCHHAKTVLEPMRALYGPLTITSGFRNKPGRSQHGRGQATDIQFLNFHGQSNTGQLYFDRAKDIRDNINYDQMILEWFGRNPWLHISSNPTTHRNNVLTQTASNSYTSGLIRLG